MLIQNYGFDHPLYFVLICDWTQLYGGGGGWAGRKGLLPLQVLGWSGIRWFLSPFWPQN